jgi:hypothetical protein
MPVDIFVGPSLPAGVVLGYTSLRVPIIAAGWSTPGSRSFTPAAVLTVGLDTTVWDQFLSDAAGSLWFRRSRMQHSAHHSRASPRPTGPRLGSAR